MDISSLQTIIETPSAMIHYRDLEVRCHEDHRSHEAVGLEIPGGRPPWERWRLPLAVSRMGIKAVANSISTSDRLREITPMGGMAIANFVGAKRHLQ
jgi:hypothetical protein